MTTVGVFFFSRVPLTIDFSLHVVSNIDSLIIITKEKIEPVIIVT